jgi:hypothetical protein
MSTKHRLLILDVTWQSIYTSSITQTHLVAKLTCVTLVADAFGDAVIAIARASNGIGIVNVANDQPGWSKDSIMAITFGIAGTILGVATVWLGVHHGVHRYRE